MPTDEIRQEILADTQGALRLFVAYIGVVHRLFDRLRERRRTPSELAADAEVDGTYVERWADAALACGLLRREAGALVLTELGEAFVLDRPGTLFPFAVQAVLGAHMAERAADLMPSGEQPGEQVLGERPTLLPLFGPMLEASFGPVFAEQVLPGLPAVRAVGERGGLAVDLGCGNGWYLRRLLARFPALRGVGLDMIPDNIDAATAAARAEGLADRLEFRQGDLHHFAVDEPAQLVAMNRALHHVWSEGGERVMAALYDHLAPGGLAVIWEPRWPDDPDRLADHPRLRGMAFQNLAEHVQGNRFLRPDEVSTAMRRVGFDVEPFFFADDTEMVIVGTRS